MKGILTDMIAVLVWVCGLALVGVPTWLAFPVLAFVAMCLAGRREMISRGWKGFR